MRGIVYTGEGVEVTDALEVRGPGPKEVQVRIQAAGVCHSDLSVINGTIPFPAPAVLGHEGAGIVEAVGDAVRSVKPGDHVVIATLASCGACRACSTGHPTMCKSSLGNISTPFTLKGEPASNFAAASVFSEVTIVSEVQAVRIPKDIPFSSACLIGCGVLTGVGAVLNRAKVRPGETAAVFGVGGVGLNVIQGLRIAGATRIVAVDTVAAKEDLGRQFGATHFVDASTGDAAAAVRELVPANKESAAGALFPLGGVTWAFDCVGHPAVLRSALECLDWGGNAVAIGIPPRGTEVPVDVNALAYVDRGLLGCRYGSARPHHDIPLMVDLYQAGLLMLDELVSLTRPLERFGEVIDEMHAGRVARRPPFRLETRHAHGGSVAVKGVILAGGTGSRLYPLTRITNKHLLPIYDRPMIAWSIETVVSSGIDEIMLVTGGTHAGEFLRLLGNGHAYGIKQLSYSYQENAGGIAEALGLAAHFAEGGPVLVMLADNILEYSIKPMVDAFCADPTGARILLSKVHEPEHLRHLGVPVFGETGRVVHIEEKPEEPASDYCVTGIYCYEAGVFDIIGDLVPSGRGELEITDVNNHYVGKDQMAHDIQEGFWGDAGESIEAYYAVNDFVRENGANFPLPT